MVAGAGSIMAALLAVRCAHRVHTVEEETLNLKTRAFYAKDKGAVKTYPLIHDEVSREL